MPDFRGDLRDALDEAISRVFLHESYEKGLEEGVEVLEALIRARVAELTLDSLEEVEGKIRAIRSGILEGK